MERKQWDIDIEKLLERITPGRVDEAALQEDTVPAASGGNKSIGFRIY